MKNLKILDCTIRDGGYYTGWDFNEELIATYFESFNRLPIDYIEIGYRSNPMKSYLGKYFYCPRIVLEDCKRRSNKELAIILNEKDVRKVDVKDLLEPCQDLVSMVRIAVDPQNFGRAIHLAEEVARFGFKVCFNVMYMSNWESEKKFLSEIGNVQGVIDYFYMVDSFGGVFPTDVKKAYDIVRSKLDVKIGFHGHNNLQLGLINTLTAIECGAEIVDATVTGMGRGAGNLSTELLLTTLNSQNRIDLDFNALSMVVDPFLEMQKDFGWGTNLPYMVSGAHSLPQKEVMEWVTKRYYSLNSITRALSNQSKGIKDNRELPKLNFDAIGQSDKVLLIGGGPSAVEHNSALTTFLKLNPKIPVIHASSKNARSYDSIKNDQYYCLVGNEGYRLEKVFDNHLEINGNCILPPFPRKMGTYIPEALSDCSYELQDKMFTERFKDSHTAIALQTAKELGSRTIYLAGYDGYSTEMIEKKEQELFLENEYLFEKITETENIKLVSLTSTFYAIPESDSVYSKIDR